MEWRLSLSMPGSCVTVMNLFMESHVLHWLSLNSEAKRFLEPILTTVTERQSPCSKGASGHLSLTGRSLRNCPKEGQEYICKKCVIKKLIEIFVALYHLSSCQLPEECLDMPPKLLPIPTSGCYRKEDNIVLQLEPFRRWKTSLDALWSYLEPVVYKVKQTLGEQSRMGWQSGRNTKPWNPMEKVMLTSKYTIVGKQLVHLGKVFTSASKPNSKCGHIYIFGGESILWFKHWIEMHVTWAQFVI